MTSYRKYIKVLIYNKIIFFLLNGWCFSDLFKLENYFSNNKI